MNKDLNFKFGIFAALTVAVIAIIILVVLNADVFSEFFLPLAVVAIILFVIWKANPVLRLRDFERAVIFRFGKVNRVGGPGWAFMLPFVESFELVELRTKTLDVPPQEVVTLDNIALKVDAVIYIKVNRDNQSVINSVVAVKDYENAVKQYVLSLIRDNIGKMNLSDLISCIEELNKRMKDTAMEMSGKWGVSIDAVQLQNIEIPKQITDAMHAEKAAIQEKLTRIERAKAQQAEIIAIKEATQGLSENALSYYYIKALEEIARGKSTKLVFPMELSKLISGVSDNFSGNTDRKSAEKLAEPYREILKDIVDDAVKKSKKEDAEKTSPD